MLLLDNYLPEFVLLCRSVEHKFSPAFDSVLIISNMRLEPKNPTCTTAGIAHFGVRQNERISSNLSHAQL